MTWFPFVLIQKKENGTTNKPFFISFHSLHFAAFPFVIHQVFGMFVLPTIVYDRKNFLLYPIPSLTLTPQSMIFFVLFFKHKIHGILLLLVFFLSFINDNSRKKKKKGKCYKTRKWITKATSTFFCFLKHDDGWKTYYHLIWVYRQISWYWKVMMAN